MILSIKKKQEEQLQININKEKINPQQNEILNSGKNNEYNEIKFTLDYFLHSYKL